MPDFKLPAATSTPMLAPWNGWLASFDRADDRGTSSSRQLVFPLGGDVNQVIDPWTVMLRFMNAQFGFINVYMGKSSDPELEKQIIDDVGTYGRQLGQLGDALQVLIDVMPDAVRAKLTPAQKDAIDAAEFQLREIARLKKARAKSR